MRLLRTALLVLLLLPVARAAAGTLTIEAASEVRDWLLLAEPRATDLRVCLKTPDAPAEYAHAAGFDATAHGAPTELVVRECGGLRVGLLGLAHAKEIEAARSKCDLLVLLSCRDRTGTIETVAKLGGADLCLCPAGALLDPLPIEVNGTWYVQVPRGGNPVGRIEVELDGKRIRTVKQSFRLGSAVSGDALRELKRKHPPGDPVRAIATEPKGWLEPETTPIPAAYELGKVAWIRQSKSNRACRFDIPSVCLKRSYGAIEAPEGGALLVLDTRWTNILDRAIVYEREVPVGYAIGSLADHLYLVADGCRVSRVDSQLVKQPGHLPARIMLGQSGDAMRGNIVFVLPTAAPKSLELRLYDFAHGNIFFPLLSGKAPEANPDTGLLRNEVLEAALFGCERIARLGERAAPEGMEFLRFDLRAKSLFTFEADASAYDPKAEKGAKLQVGTVADWAETDRHLTAVVDGEYAYPIEPETRLGAKPRFLPDPMTGEQVVFLVPRERQSLEVLCEFPNAQLPGGGGLIHPTPLRFGLEGEAPGPRALQPLVEIEDEPLLIAITGQSRIDGKLLWDVTVSNRGKKGEFLQTEQQIRFLASDGSAVGMHESSLTGPRRAMKLLRIPPGERRSFRLRFRIAASETKPRLAYRGFTFANEYVLPALEGAPPAEEKKPAPPPPPPPPPVKRVETKRPPEAKPITPPAGVAGLEGRALAGFQPAAVTGKNVELQVLDARLTKIQRKSKAEEGMDLLVLQLHWKRVGSDRFLSERLYQSLRLRTHGRFLQPPWNSSYAEEEGFLPSSFQLDDKRTEITAKAVFEIPEQTPGRLSLMHAADPDNVLVIPLRTDDRPVEPLPEITRVDNEALTIVVHEVVDPGAEVVERLKEAGYLPTRKTLVGLRVSVHSKDETRDLGYINQRWRLVAGGDFPAREFFEPGYGPSGIWPVWPQRIAAVPGVADHGLLLYAVPDPELSLEVEFDLTNIQVEGGKKLADPNPRLLVRKGKRRERPEALATFEGKDWRVELLGVQHGTLRDYSLIALDLRVRAPTRRNLYYFGPSELSVIDQVGRRQSACGEDHLPFENPRKFTMGPGGERRFVARYVLSERGNYLWLRHPDGCPDKMVRLPNPWVAAEPPGEKLELIPYRKKETFEFTPPPLFPEPGPKGIEAVGLTGKQVNDAIRKGAAWLAKSFERGFRGQHKEHPLVILALLHSGELHKYPELQAQAIACLETRKFQGSYDLSLTAMGLAHVDPQRYRERIRNIAQALVDAQVEQGGWGYMSKEVRKIEPGTPAAAGDPEKKADEPAGRVEVDDGGPIADWPGSGKTEKVTLERTTPLKKDYCDNSCSQYAVLGLLAASHAGVHAPRETWERVVAWYLDAQTDRRGWGYGRKSKSTGSMTTAGIAGFAVARHVLGGLNEEQGLVLRTGVDWLARNYRLDDNPNAEGSWQYYYLYGLERAGRLLAKEFIGDHEWYAEGARYLVDNQGGGGSWKVKHSDEVLDTCFAILFLTRATEKLGEKKEAPTGPGWLEVEARSASGALVFILDASASMMADLGDETRFKAARRVVLEVLQGSGSGLEVALRAYGHRYRANKPEARTDSELVVGFGPPDRAELSSALAKMRCRGKTPLTYSVLESIKDLEGAKSKDRRVVLLTDGMESDRRAKPLEAAASIREAGARLDVVCFCMDSTELMEKMAAAGGGACYSASDAEQLLAALKTAVVGDVAFRVLGADGAEVAKGKTGDRIELPAGPYTVEIALPGGARQVKAWIHQDRTTKLRVR